MPTCCWALPFVCSLLPLILFIFDCTGSSLLRTSFLQLQRAGGYSLLWCADSLRWPLLLWSMGPGARGLQWLWCVGLVALQNMESSQTRDGTHVPCIGRWTLNHWITREVLSLIFNTYYEFPKPKLFKGICAFLGVQVFTWSQNYYDVEVGWCV